MKEQNQIETKIKNLTFITVFGFLVLAALVIGLYFKDGKVGESKINIDSNNTEVEYDVSKMVKVTGDEAAALFDKKGTQYLYIGRPTCGVCVSLVPQLNTVLNNMNITLYYSELKDTFRTDFKNLFDKLTMETSVTSNGKTYEGTFGKVINEAGFTPVIVVIKDGKMVDGFIGYKSASDIEEMFKKHQ